MTEGSPFCDCGGRGARIGFVQHPDETEEWYVCAGCLKPARVGIELEFQRALEGQDEVLDDV